MKRIIFIILIFVIFLGFNAYASNSGLINMRNKMLEESKDLKLLLATSKDVVLVNSMCDSCIIAMSQLDAYFSMVGIFNTIKKQDLKESAVNYLGGWLEGIRQTNKVNIRSLNTVMPGLEPKTKSQVAKLKDYFDKLNSQIDSELEKISILRKSLKRK